MNRRLTPKQYHELAQRHGDDYAAAGREAGVHKRTVWENARLYREAQGIERPAYIPPSLEVNGISRAAQAQIEDLKAQLEAVTQVKRWKAAKPRKRTARKPSGAKHLLIPDTQVKYGVPLEHLTAAGNYAAEKRPDTIVIIGDWFDMPSLSSYDKGKLAYEGRRYRLDIEAGKAGMEMFLAPIRKAKGYRPRIVFTTGNHEARIDRLIQENPNLEGFIGMHDLQLANFGIEAHPFLDVVVIDGVAYSHYFPRSANGSVGQTKNGAPNARAQLIREGRSCCSGHKQGLDLACAPLAGRMQWSIQAGSFYSHSEAYLSAQGNAHYRGLVMMHEVKDGGMTPCLVSLDYLLAEYQ